MQITTPYGANVELREHVNSDQFWTSTYEREYSKFSPNSGLFSDNDSEHFYAFENSQ